MMPQDVSTCWNSMYDMVKFAIEYHDALNIMMANHDMNLHKFELSKRNGVW